MGPTERFASFLSASAPRPDFITLHYAWIVFVGILGLVVIYPYGNIAAVDAYFFGASASTESGLNTVDVKALKTYQQIVIYIIPIITNLGFINIFVVAIRIHWFQKSARRQRLDLSRQCVDNVVHLHSKMSQQVIQPEMTPHAQTLSDHNEAHRPQGLGRQEDLTEPLRHIKFADQDDVHIESGSTLFGKTRNLQRNDSVDPKPIAEDSRILIADEKKNSLDDDRKDNDSISAKAAAFQPSEQDLSATRGTVASLDRAAADIFVLGPRTRTRSRSRSASRTQQHRNSIQSLPALSRTATIGRNSRIIGLSVSDREVLHGIEYRSLKLLLKVVIGYFFGLHLFGALCLVVWIRHCNEKYRDYLESQGQDKIWWAFYSAQTMVDNLGFTLTPDSMISFRDAIFPMILMSFLAFAGNTFYPILLRLVLWVMSKFTKRTSTHHEPLRFLLDHPRRCYVLLFPSTTTWVLFGILIALNSIDVLLILVLDLDNPEVNVLPWAQRLFASIFQAASSRHTGTSTFNLANVNPAVQFSLLVMMYIAIFPIALSVRSSNTYEEKSLGIYEKERELDEQRGRSYIMSHVRNQLSFDLWYIFLGVFCICISESDKIMDSSNTAFAVFPIFFEVVSAYGNVGLSLGHPAVLTSLCGQFTTFGKLVICAMMIRGRHRGLPYSLDKAISLPGQAEHDEE